VTGKNRGTKRYSVAGFFPEAKAHRAHQLCRVVANDLAQAAKAGLKELRKREGIKGHPITTVELRIRFIEKIAESEKSIAAKDAADAI
jgi:hypothetical protein